MPLLFISKQQKAEESVLAFFQLTNEDEVYSKEEVTHLPPPPFVFSCTDSGEN